MTDAKLAVLISAIALLGTVGLVVWEVARYVLEGGRVKVRIQRGWLDDYSLTTARAQAKEPPAGVGHVARLHHEVLVLTVTNRGRTATTITNPSVSLNRELLGLQRWAFWTKRWWVRRHTVGPHRHDFQDAVTTTTHRLEPFDIATYVLDLDPVIETLQERKRRSRLRGWVQVAGRRRAAKSRRWKAMRVEAGSRSVDGELPPRDVLAYRLLARQKPTNDDEPAVLVTFLAHQIRKAELDGKPLHTDALSELVASAIPRGTPNYRSLGIAFSIENFWMARGHTRDPKPEEDPDSDDEVGSPTQSP